MSTAENHDILTSNINEQSINEDDIVYIPCEFCENQIAFNEYELHVVECRQRYVIPPLFLAYAGPNIDYHGIIRQAINVLDRLENTNPINEQEEANNEDGSNTSDQDDSGLAEDDEYIPQTRSFQHQTLLIIPRMSSLINQLAESNSYEYNILIEQTLGRVYVGIEDIESVLSKVDASKITEEDVCPICREDLIKIPCDQLSETSCKHIFCNVCISKWLKQSKRCPVCNIDLQEEYKKT